MYFKKHYVYNIKTFIKFLILRFFYFINILKNRKFNLLYLNKLKEKNQYLYTINSDSLGGTIMQITYLYKICKIYNLNIKKSFHIIGNKKCNKFLLKKLNDEIKINYNNKLYDHLTKLGQFNYFVKNKIGVPYPNDYLNFLPYDDYSISFNDSEKEYGFKLLEKLNVKEGDNVVAVSWKSNFYWSLRGKKKSWDTYRFSDPTNLESGLKFLTNKNYKIVLVGDNEKCKLNELYPSVSNLSGNEREFLDIFIFSIVKFNILGEQGLKPLPNLFEKKTLHHNALAPKWQCQDILLPKIFVDTKSSKIIEYDELIKRRLLILRSDENNIKLEFLEPLLFNNIDYFEYVGIKLKQNSPDEIKNGIMEVEELFLKGDLNLTREQKKIQSLYRSKFNNYYTKNKTSKYNNFNYGLNFGGYVSPYFLKKYKFLF